MAQFSSAPFSVEIALSRKFWSAENFGPRTEIFGKFGPGGQSLAENLGPPFVRLRDRWITSVLCPNTSLWPKRLASWTYQNDADGARESH